MNKNILKKWYFWMILIMLIIFLLTIIGMNNLDNGVGEGGINEEEFSKIVIGETTQFELDDIIDKNDLWDNDERYIKCVEKIDETKEDHKYTYVYKYYGEKKGYAIITLQADYTNENFYNDVIVIKKENYNLK